MEMDGALNIVRVPFTEIGVLKPLYVDQNDG